MDTVNFISDFISISFDNILELGGNSNSSSPFEHIDHALYGIRSLIVECADEFNEKCNYDFSNCIVRCDWKAPVKCTGSDQGIISIGYQIGMGLLPVKDTKFILFHEMRHLWQYKSGTLLNQYPTLRWKDGTITSYDRVFDMIRNNELDLYGQLPWEADANGFAHYIMNEYIPEDANLRTFVKYCTRPREFY